MSRENVLRLDVPVDHTLLMGVLECSGDNRCDLHGFFHRKLLLTIKPLPERLAFDERDGVKV